MQSELKGVHPFDQADKLQRFMPQNSGFSRQDLQDRLIYQRAKPLQLLMEGQHNSHPGLYSGYDPKQYTKKYDQFLKPHELEAPQLYLSPGRKYQLPEGQRDMANFLTSYKTPPKRSAAYNGIVSDAMPNAQRIQQLVAARKSVGY